MRSERRPVTINDVARAAGVSRAAVSKVIRDAYGVSPEMRARVNQAIERLGYRPSVAARALRGSSYRLGLEIPLVGARFMTQIVDGATSALAQTSYQLVLAPADGPEYSAIVALADGLVDGIVVVSPLVAPDWLEELAQRVPVVMLGRHDDPVHYDTVVGDDTVGATAVMRHLLELGHRRIAHLTEGEAVTAPASRTPHAIRLRVYTDMMVEAGLGSLVRVVRRGPGEEGARVATRELLAGPEPPTAIFAGHDDLAVEVLAAIAETRRPYGEVSVVGYDNTDLAEHPLISLTSVDQAGVVMGAEAVTMLLERIAGRTEARQHLVTPRLVVRRSTTPPPRARSTEATSRP